MTISKNKKLNKKDSRTLLNKKIMCSTMLCMFLSVQGAAFSLTDTKIGNGLIEERVLGIEQIGRAHV